MWKIGTGLFLVLAATNASAATAPTGACAQVEIIGARGTDDTPGFGFLLGPIADNVQQDSTRTIGLYPLPYPASFSPTYQSSEAAGESDLKSYLISQAAACPDQSLVLMGYSQGAQVVNNVLAGGTIAPATAKRIVAVTTFGDPDFNSAESFDQGSFIKGFNGLLGARAPGSESAYQNVIQSYCNTGDEICQTIGSLVAHLEYQVTAGGLAQTYILGKLGD